MLGHYTTSPSATPGPDCSTAEGVRGPRGSADASRLTGWQRLWLARRFDRAREAGQPANGWIAGQLLPQLPVQAPHQAGCSEQEYELGQDEQSVDAPGIGR